MREVIQSIKLIIIEVPAFRVKLKYGVRQNNFLKCLHKVLVSGLKPLITAKEKIALLKFSMPPVAKNNDEIVKQISPLLTNMPPCAGPLSVKIKVF